MKDKNIPLPSHNYGFVVQPEKIEIRLLFSLTPHTKRTTEPYGKSSQHPKSKYAILPGMSLLNQYTKS